MTLNDLNMVLKTNIPQEEGFKEVRRRKRHNFEEAARTAKKAAIPTSSTKVTTKNFFAPFRTAQSPTQLRNQFQVKRAGRLQ
jgi:hypothetical protein